MQFFASVLNVPLRVCPSPAGRQQLIKGTQKPSGGECMASVISLVVKSEPPICEA